MESKRTPQIDEWIYRTMGPTIMRVTDVMTDRGRSLLDAMKLRAEVPDIFTDAERDSIIDAYVLERKVLGLIEELKQLKQEAES